MNRSFSRWAFCLPLAAFALFREMAVVKGKGIVVNLGAGKDSRIIVKEADNRAFEK